ncbi:MAG: phospho-sugar mutase [Oscillospiraceae bacterium]|nr:phospho-sugar mutase [Oscillospiraceae bacterium]
MNWKNSYDYWMNSEALDKELKEELLNITDEDELSDRFYRELEFGTAGLRGVIGAGSNRMNIHTVDRATRGFAEHLLTKSASPACAIGYDSRIKSDVFAKVAAAALAAKGVKVWLYQELIPTPMLSFAVRYLHCDGGIVITASHNPAKYNGYKAYGSDGCQLDIEESENVMHLIEKEEMIAAELPSFDKLLAEGKICYIGTDLTDAYYDMVASLSLCPPQVETKVVYSPLNGTGNKPVRTMLQRIGNINVTVVPEQELPDGNFPTCPYPNPEIEAAMRLAAQLAKEVGADFCRATDPDCDRVGAGVVTDDGVRLISGNEMGVMLFDYVCRMRTQNGTMPKNPTAIKTVVTTGMTARVAEKYGVELCDLLTGFKFIGGKIGEWEAEGEENRFIFGFEESYGYLSGTAVRDKDAVNASMLICEMAAYYKSQGKNLLQALESLYEEYGYYRSELVNMAFEGASGMEKMTAIMNGIRENTPTEFAGIAVEKFIDYKFDETGLPVSNMLRFLLADKSEIVVRPSGTEPKLKLYVTASAETEDECRKTAAKLAESCKKLTEI